MNNHSKHLAIFVSYLLSGALITACGGASTGPRQAQNIVYLDDATNSRRMADT